MVGASVGSRVADGSCLVILFALGISGLEFCAVEDVVVFRRKKRIPLSTRMCCLETPPRMPGDHWGMRRGLIMIGRGKYSQGSKVSERPAFN